MINSQVRHFAAIAGRATDETTGMPVAGARVEIVSSPEEFQRLHQPVGRGIASSTLACTGRDGHFHFLDLPNGNYEIQVSVPGVPPANVSVAVARTPEVVAPPETADVKLNLVPPKGDIEPPKSGPRAISAKPKPERRPKDKKL